MFANMFAKVFAKSRRSASFASAVSPAAPPADSPLSDVFPAPDLADAARAAGRAVTAAQATLRRCQQFYTHQAYT